MIDKYLVYLEIARNGACLAHVPSLPGCNLRTPTREEALRRLPDAIVEYSNWLRRHGEVVPAVQRHVPMEIAGESVGFGPFDPGDAAALLPPDREPLDAPALELHLRLMGYSRADLLGLVRSLPDEVLDWQATADEASIRRVLRHIGNAEEWYISRLVPPDSLPPEWAGDDALPILEFLEMERRTAVGRLRQLPEAERAGVFYATEWTEHPEEPWTARKVLRRFLEHEREHTAQIRQIMGLYRSYLMARLAAERAALMQQLLGLEHHSLVRGTVAGNWSVKDVLAHVAGRDRWEHRAMVALTAGQALDLSAMRDVAAAHTTFVETWHDRSLDQVLQEMISARAEWTEWLHRVPEEEFFRCRGEDWDCWFPSCVEVEWTHDAKHGLEIAEWRKAGAKRAAHGPRVVILAALDAAREELMAAVATVPEDQLALRPVCGHWTVRDVVGHIADWEWYGVQEFESAATGRAPRVEPVLDIDLWNEAHVQARLHQPWEEALADLQAARQSLLELVHGMVDATLARPLRFGWGETATPYSVLCEFLEHDREHARVIREPLPLG